MHLDSSLVRILTVATQLSIFNQDSASPTVGGNKQVGNTTKAKATSKPTFVALDFETANRLATSVCAIGLVRVDEGQISQRFYQLVRPPYRRFEYTRIHHITWEMVAHSPLFAHLWPTLQPYFDGASFIAAHNASFDRNVLHRCCELWGLSPPDLPFTCSMKLARAKWHLPRNRLSDVAKFLNLPLNHHHAGSDAEACARIVLCALV